MVNTWTEPCPLVVNVNLMDFLERLALWNLESLSASIKGNFEYLAIDVQKILTISLALVQSAETACPHKSMPSSARQLMTSPLEIQREDQNHQWLDIGEKKWGDPSED